MTWTIWYDSYYYIEGERLQSVLGQWSDINLAKEAMRNLALLDMRTFILKNKEASSKTPPWVIIGDDDGGEQSSFTLGIRDNVTDTFYSHVKVHYKVVEIDNLSSSLPDIERQTILQLMKHHSGDVPNIYPVESMGRVNVNEEE